MGMMFTVGVTITPPVTENAELLIVTSVPVVIVAIPVVTLAVTKACAVGNPVVTAL